MAKDLGTLCNVRPVGAHKIRRPHYESFESKSATGYREGATVDSLGVLVEGWLYGGNLTLKIVNVLKEEKEIEKYHTGMGIPRPYPRPWRVGFGSRILYPGGYGFGFGSKFNYKGTGLCLEYPEGLDLKGVAGVWERLGRCLVNELWQNMFPRARGNQANLHEDPDEIDEIAVQHFCSLFSASTLCPSYVEDYSLFFMEATNEAARKIKVVLGTDWEEIRRAPRSPVASSDELVWHHEKNGFFFLQ
ncbi:hypothetical protein M9H77_07843 [Catharanthus roseus]|uniref:Uncharacterized protein n=1 Tax=Catharanthus roseus TaxID=4058 RepID=A0ACC0BWD5_CATRO|nr:hypothetical protein M9H77_07843 [Catharanthus roseus]